MLKSTIFALLLTVCGTVYSEPFTVNRTLTCDNLTAVIELLKTYGEKVAWQSQSDKGLSNILTVNNDTQTWTIVITNGQSACLVDSGKGFKMEPTKESTPAPGKGSLNRIVM